MDDAYIQKIKKLILDKSTYHSYVRDDIDIKFEALHNNDDDATLMKTGLVYEVVSVGKVEGTRTSTRASESSRRLRFARRKRAQTVCEPTTQIVLQ